MAPACGPNLRRLDSELSDPGYLHSDAATRMLLTLSTTRSPATDLGYLLHKNPARVQSFDLSFGKAHVFYPEADECRYGRAAPGCRPGLAGTGAEGTGR